MIWQTRRLCNICSLVKGKKPEKFYIAGKVPYLTASVIRGTETPKYTNASDPDSVWVNKEDLVIIMDGSNSGEMFTRLEGALASTMGVVNFSKDLLNPTYLLHFLETHRENFTKSRTGSAIPHLNKEQFENLEISFPGLSEQKRIVTILDGVFENIYKARENTEKNLQNSKELFKSYIQNIFTKVGINCETKCLEDLGQITSSKRIFKREYVRDGVPFYRIKEIKELANDKIISTDLFITNSKYNQIKKSFGVPHEGDLLMTAVGTIGEIYEVNGSDAFYFKDGNVLWFKDFRQVDPHYLKFVLVAFIENIKKMSKGSAYSALTIEKIKKHRISFPKKISEQKEIVKKIDELSEQTKKLEENYKQKLLLLDELKKSVLQEAFS